MDLSKFVGSKIKSLREKHKMTQEDLAKVLDTTRQSISRYEQGQRKAGQDELFELSDYFNVSIDYFFPTTIDKTDIQDIYDQLHPPRQHKVLNYAENQLEEQNGIVKLSGYIKENIPEYTTSGLYGALSAGTGQQIFDNPIEEVEIPTSIIPDEPYDIMLKIVGDSMQPAFEDGEYVFIKLTKEIRSGQFAAIIVDGEAFLKKVYVEENQMRLVSLNKKYEDIIVNEHSNVEVVGTVVL